MLDITKMKDLFTVVGVLIILPLAKPLEPGCKNGNLISGVESLPNSSFTASSYWSGTNKCLPHYGRLNATGLQGVYCEAWAPSVVNQDQYIQVHLAKMMHITKILTQGRRDGVSVQRVTSYRVRYSVDEKMWSWLKDGAGNALILTLSTTSSYATDEQILSTPITAMFIRIYPYTWEGYPSMRFDVIGCIKQVAMLKSGRWRSSPQLNGYNITAGIIWRQEVRNLGVCSIRCGELESCVSFLYSDKNVCQLYKEIFASPSDFSQFSHGAYKYFFPY